jgi:hypothetical protein
MYDVPAYLPFRSVPQEYSYPFLRGINASFIFWQDPSAAEGTGKYLEPSSLANTPDCSTVTTLAQGSATRTNDANKQTLWGFKEHPNLFGYYYVYERSASRSPCAAKWLTASLDCTVTTGPTLTSWYGNDTLWRLIHHDRTEKNTPQTSTMENPWSGDPYTWKGTYSFRHAGRAGSGITKPCLKTDLGYDGTAFVFLDP